MNRKRGYEAESDTTDVLGTPELTPEELAAEWAADSPPPSGPIANLAASLVAAGSASQA